MPSSAKFSHFSVGDTVKAGTSAQGMTSGQVYEITDLQENPTPFGNFVNYKIKGQDGRAFWIVNAHLLVTKMSAPADAKFSRHAACFGCGRSFLRAELVPGKGKSGPRCAKCREAGDDGSLTAKMLDRPLRPAPQMNAGKFAGGDSEVSRWWNSLDQAKRQRLLPSAYGAWVALSPEEKQRVRVLYEGDEGPYGRTYPGAGIG